MTHELTRRAGEVFIEVCELDESARARVLDERCAGDAELRAAVMELLDLDAASDLLSDEAVDAGWQFHEGVSAMVTSAKPPARVGRYRVLREIGAGGMGTVYVAEQDNPRRQVALKMIRPGVLSAGLLRRFEQEVELLGRLQHPGIAQIHEAGTVQTEAGPWPFFAMELVDGIELRRYARERDLDVPGRLELVARICDAVQHAHAKGVIHRDLKPDNVLVVDGAPPADGGDGTRFADLGQPKVLDFGVARATDKDARATTLLTEVGQLVGTLAYMSPEQVLGDSAALDTRSDIHALGVMLYELLAGRLPYEVTNKPVPEAARIIREDEPTRLASLDTAFRGDIDTIVGMALEKDRERRYASAAEMAADIRRCLADEPIVAHPPSSFYQLRKFARRHRGLVVGLAAALFILVAGVISSLVFASRALESAQLSRENEQRALDGEAAARHAAYRLGITAAGATGATDPLAAREHLAAAPTELRGWEWHYLSARFGDRADPVERRSGFGGPVCALRPDGVLVSARLREGAIEVVEVAAGEIVARFADPGGLATRVCPRRAPTW